MSKPTHLEQLTRAKRYPITPAEYKAAGLPYYQWPMPERENKAAFEEYWNRRGYRVLDGWKPPLQSCPLNHE